MLQKQCQSFSLYCAERYRCRCHSLRCEVGTVRFKIPDSQGSKIYHRDSSYMVLDLAVFLSRSNESTGIAADGNSLEITPLSSTLTVRVAKTITEIVTTWFWSLDV